MSKTYKYQLSQVAYDRLPNIDKIYYGPIYQYREPDHYIWNDCHFSEINRTYVFCIGARIETRLIYRLKQI